MKVLITRPKHSAANLALALTLTPKGFTSICFPSIDIVPIVGIEDFSENVHQCDIVIFVSVHAVNAFFTLFDKISLDLKRVLAIGQATAKALEQHHVVVHDVPSVANSENLLALASLQNMAKKQVVIFAGVDGREALQTTLLQRGAIVKMVYLYQRVVPHYTLPLQWHVGDIDVSLTTSGQGLANFDQLIHQYQLLALYNKPLIVINEAMISQARQLGFKSAIIRADGASNIDVLAALQKEFT